MDCLNQDFNVIDLIDFNKFNQANY